MVFLLKGDFMDWHKEFQGLWNKEFEGLYIMLDSSFKKREEEFQAYNKLCEKSRELIFVACTTGINGHYMLDMFRGEFEEILELSPIEQILQVAFWVYEVFNEERISVCMSMERQKEILCGNKKYVADFVLECWQKFDGNKGEMFSVDFKTIKPIIIECDGFEFHSNKQQMQNDYERENNLKNAGYDVLRFTGSQIYNKPLQTVKKIIEYLKKNSILNE